MVSTNANPATKRPCTLLAVRLPPHPLHHQRQLWSSDVELFLFEPRTYVGGRSRRGRSDWTHLRRGRNRIVVNGARIMNLSLLLCRLPGSILVLCSPARLLLRPTGCLDQG